MKTGAFFQITPSLQGNPLGDATNDDLRIVFDSRLKLKFCGSQVTTDDGLLAYRELDEVLGLTEMGADLLIDSRLGSNKQHLLVPLLRRPQVLPEQYGLRLAEADAVAGR